MFVHVRVPSSQFNTETSDCLQQFRPHLGFIQLIVFLHYLVAFYRQLCNLVLWHNSITFIIAMHILIWRKTLFHCHPPRVFVLLLRSRNGGICPILSFFPLHSSPLSLPSFCLSEYLCSIWVDFELCPDQVFLACLAIISTVQHHWCRGPSDSWR